MARREVSKTVGGTGSLLDNSRAYDNMWRSGGAGRGYKMVT